MDTSFRSQASEWARAAILACVLGAPVIRGVQAAEPAAASNSATVIGANRFLTDGAQALSSGDWQRGVHLTEQGLAGTLSNSDRAAALANMCAGFVGLKQFAKALGYCDQSLVIYDGNWRTWQNRAASNLGLGKIDDALRDLQRGLQINPDSDALQKTLAIARGYEQLQQERLENLLES